MKSFILIVVGSLLIEVLVGFIVSDGKLKATINAVISIFIFYIMVNSLFALFEKLQF